MTVYVDSAFIPYRNMLMCHMIADSREELDQMADLIGVNRKWIQDPGTYREHYDIAKSKRQLAIENGAIEITFKEFGYKLLERKKVFLESIRANKTATED